FTGPLLLAALQAAAAIGLFAAARHCARRGGWTVHGARAAGAGGALLLLPSLIATFGAPAVAAERNLYSLGLEVALAEPPPSRRPVDLQPDLAGTPRHVVRSEERRVGKERRAGGSQSDDEIRKTVT